MRRGYLARPAEALAAFVGGVAAAHAIVLLAGAMGWRSRTMVEAAIPDMPTTAVQVSLVKALVDVLSFRRVLPAGRRWRGRVGPRPSSACSPVARSARSFSGSARGPPCWASRESRPASRCSTPVPPITPACERRRVIG